MRTEILTLPELSNRILTLGCLCLALGILLFGLWPLAYAPPNHAEISEQEGAIRFFRNGDWSKLDVGGLAYTPKPLSYGHSEDSTGSLTLEISARSSEQFKSGLGLLAAFCDEAGNVKLLLAQWESHLIIRTFFFKSKRGNYTEIGLKSALMPGQTSFITITSDRTGTTLYLNGKRVRKIANIRLIPDNAKFVGYRLYFGNDLSLAHPWQGELLGFALYDHAKTRAEVAANFDRWQVNSWSPTTDAAGAVIQYTFKNKYFSEKNGITVLDSTGGRNALLIPNHIPFKKPLLEYSGIRSNGAIDIIINLLGFIPFGYFLAQWFNQVARRSIYGAIVAAVLCGFLLSLFIEVFQAYLPTRCSSLTDLVCNTVGTFIGAALLRYTATRKKRLPQTNPVAKMLPG